MALSRLPNFGGKPTGRRRNDDSEPHIEPADIAALCRRPSVAPTDKITLGDPQLDALLRGGVPVGLITEFAGEASAGKSQLSMQLCLAVQRPREQGGLGGDAMYGA